MGEEVEVAVTRQIGLLPPQIEVAAAAFLTEVAAAAFLTEVVAAAFLTEVVAAAAAFQVAALIGEDLFAEVHDANRGGR
jgi:hypothetical protein